MLLSQEGSEPVAQLNCVPHQKLKFQLSFLHIHLIIFDTESGDCIAFISGKCSSFVHTVYNCIMYLMGDEMAGTSG